MPTIPEILLNEAFEIANDIISRAQEGDPSITNIQNRKRQIEAALKAVKVPAQRLGGYQPLIKGDLQCPHCWVLGGVHAILRPMPGTAEEDCFRCSMCVYEITTPNG